MGREDHPLADSPLPAEVDIDLDRLEELFREFREERYAIEAAVAANREVAADIRRAAGLANDAAASISYEASRLRR